jgi:hypothetical protein
LSADKSNRACAYSSYYNNVRTPPVLGQRCSCVHRKPRPLCSPPCYETCSPWMRQSLALVTAAEILGHARSLADFITTTSGFRFSVHTGHASCPASRQLLTLNGRGQEPIRWRPAKCLCMPARSVSTQSVVRCDRSEGNRGRATRSHRAVQTQGKRLSLLPQPLPRQQAWRP